MTLVLPLMYKQSEYDAQTLAAHQTLLDITADIIRHYCRH